MNCVALSGKMVDRTKTPDYVKLNRDFFADQSVVESYKVPAIAQLFKGEAAIFARIKIECSDKRILDIGVGGGRTTAALLEISGNYIGIDVEPSMISACRERFPSVYFEVCDARDLSRFETEHFDLVFFSFNGIDYIGHTGRLQALREIHRVLARGGSFGFCSHNLRSHIAKPWRSTKLLTINPFKHPRCYSKRVIEVVLDTVNHMKNRRQEQYHNGFAIINDGPHYRLLSYYINVETQVRQLNESGFNSIETIDRSGRWLLPGDYASCQDTWLHYLCRKG